jgi:hypothetical protein
VVSFKRAPTFDTSALLTLRGGEPYADRVAEVLQQAAKGIWLTSNVDGVGASQ